MPEVSDCCRRIRSNRYPAPIQRNRAVSHCTMVAFTAKTLPGVAGGTKCGVLFAAECISMTSSRLPLVGAYSHPIAIEIAVTVIR